MTPAQRRSFDALVEKVLASLPSRLHQLLEEAPLLVEDHPSRELLRELEISEGEVLCGLHSGTPLTERSVAEGGDLPETIHLFREGIIEQAGGWEESEDQSGRLQGGEAAITEEIRITLLHEIGHHFGLGEEELEELGYG